MQLALFDSLEELWESAVAATGRTHPRTSADTRSSRPRTNALGVGAGAPPVTTADGLILFFHERDNDGHYTTRVALLDPESGQRPLDAARPDHAPKLPWERNGDVDNVVFVQGAVPRPDGMIYLTYGAADRCVGAATVDTAALLTALRAT